MASDRHREGTAGRRLRSPLRQLSCYLLDKEGALPSLARRQAPRSRALPQPSPSPELHCRGWQSAVRGAQLRQPNAEPPKYFCRPRFAPCAPRKGTFLGTSARFTESGRGGIRAQTRLLTENIFAEFHCNSRVIAHYFGEFLTTIY